MARQASDVELWRLLNVPGIAITPEVVSAYLAAALDTGSPESMYLSAVWICEWLKHGTAAPKAGA